MRIVDFMLKQRSNIEYSNQQRPGFGGSNERVLGAFSLGDKRKLYRLHRCPSRLFAKLFEKFFSARRYSSLKREFVAVTRRSTKERYGGGDSRKNFGETSFGQSLVTTATFDWFRHFQIWVQGACLSSEAKTSQLQWVARKNYSGVGGGCQGNLQKDLGVR